MDIMGIDINTISLIIALIIIILSLIALVFICSRQNKIDTTINTVYKFRTATHKNAPVQHNKINCSATTVYGIDDRECQDICETSNIYVSQNGRCVTYIDDDDDNDEGNDISNAQNKCDARQGLLAFLVGNTTLGTANYECLSIDLGVRSDNINDKNLMCLNGDIDINYLNSMPQPEDCTCPENKIKVFVSNTKTTRTYVQCVDKKLKPIFEHNNLI